MLNENWQIQCYGCTEAQLREQIESSITFKVSGAEMIVGSLMSDAQEEISPEYGPVTAARLERARQTLNRAKFVLFRYVEKRPEVAA